MVRSVKRRRQSHIRNEPRKVHTWHTEYSESIYVHSSHSPKILYNHLHDLEGISQFVLVRVSVGSILVYVVSTTGIVTTGFKDIEAI